MAVEVLAHPFKTAFLFSVIPGDFQTPSPIGSELGDWGVSRVVAIQAGALDMWGKQFSSLREPGNWGSYLIVRCRARGGVYGVNLSQLFLLILMYFLGHLVFRSALTIFWISLRGNWFMRNCLLGTSVEGKPVRSLLSSIFLTSYNFLQLHNLTMSESHSPADHNFTKEYHRQSPRKVLDGELFS